MFSLSRLCVISLASVALFSGGCRDTDDASHDSTARTSGSTTPATTGDDASAARGPELSVTGCLTANIDGGSYALTPNDTAGTPSERTLQVPGRETVTYELVGNGEDFRRHANTVVTVRGREDVSARREKDVEHEGRPQQQSPAAGTKDTPSVETKEEVEVNVRRLHADSVVASGNACPSIAPRTDQSTDAPKGATGTTQGGSGARPGDQRR